MDCGGFGAEDRGGSMWWAVVAWWFGAEFWWWLWWVGVGLRLRIVVDRWAVAHGRLWCVGGLRGYVLWVLCVVVQWWQH